jgi:hypothetical protein
MSRTIKWVKKGNSETQEYKKTVKKIKRRKDRQKIKKELRRYV